MQVMSNKQLEKELEYFKENQEQLVEKYNGKFLVIRNQVIKGVYETEIEAYKKASSEFELGTFLIQQALPGEESYTQTFQRVSIS